MLNRVEFEKSLNNAIGYWQEMTKKEIEEIIGAEVAIMQGFDQKNPHHCYDLFTHILTTVDNLEYATDKALAIAAFFHDIGKPNVARWKKDRLVFYGHAKNSAIITKNILEKMSFSAKEIELILFYIVHHDDFISYILPEEVMKSTNEHQIVIDEKNIKKYIDKLVKQNYDFFCRYDVIYILDNLLNLCVADVKSQAPKVYMNDILVDSMEHKLLKLNRIRELINIGIK